MIFNPAALQDALIIEPERHGDHRGYLARTFCEHEFAEHGLETRFVQASTVFSPKRGTLRGLHFQREPHAEVKLVRCTRGAAHVVIADLRPDSHTHMRWMSVDLTAANGTSLYVPKGFAQGYQTLVDDTELAYQMSHDYVPDAAAGVRWDDPGFGIVWPRSEHRTISDRDRAWPDFHPMFSRPGTIAAAELDPSST